MLWSKKLAVNEKSTPLIELRRLMRAAKIGIYLVYTQDEHMSEYVANRDKRVQYVSNFTGSTAVAIIGLDFAELAVDSRYYLTARNEISADWTVRELGKPDVLPVKEAVVKYAAASNVNVGVDPAFILSTEAVQLQHMLEPRNLKLKPVANLVDKIWSTQPQLPSIPVVRHPLKYTGEPAASKVCKLRLEMCKQNVNAFVMFDLTEIAYTLNLRGGDVPYTPVFKSFLIIMDEIIVLYTDSTFEPAKSCEEGVTVVVKPYKCFLGDLKRLPKRVWVPYGASWAISRCFYAMPVSEISPINTMRAIKNKTEIHGEREAQIKCSLSMVKYLAWLEREISVYGNNSLTEWQAAEKLIEIRTQLPNYMGLSYEVISSYGPNSSMPHYAPTESSQTLVTDKDIYLLDSGSQFKEGTTDITRTVHFGTPREDHVQAYTLVLKGQLAVSSAVFPDGRNASGLDFLARQFLWKHGLDYGHGTGHGVGSYLCVHELPLGIFPTSNWQSNLHEGHFLTVEPGYYKANDFGIRIENDVLVIPDTVSEGKKYVKFEILTKVPYYRKLIDTSKLTKEEILAINEFHKSCLSSIDHLLTEDYERDWLAQQCEPL